MTSPDNDVKRPIPLLDAEREKLRNAGYSDTEISQILVARALNSSGPGGHTSAFQGALSNTISSVVAIGSYARNTVFTLKNDLAVIFDRTARASSRVGAAIMLIFKLAVVSVLAFAGWQEWRQHIISATEIAESQARKVKAEECSARMKAFIDNTPINQLLNGNDDLARDCDPTYARRKALEDACTKKFEAIFAPINETMTADAVSKFADKLDENMTSYKSECAFTEKNKEYGRRKYAALEKFLGVSFSTLKAKQDESNASPSTRSVSTQEAALLPPPKPGPFANEGITKKAMQAVMSDQLTLRKGADKTAEAIVLLNKGTQVEVMNTDANGWSQVQLADQGSNYTGYVNSRYLTQDLSASPIPVILTEPASFDKPAFCGHETKPIEIVVCSNDDLAYLDGAMGKAYQILLAKDRDPNALTRSQTQWTNERRRNCNIPSNGRLAGPITSNMIQCVMGMTAVRTRDLRAGRY